MKVRSPLAALGALALSLLPTPSCVPTSPLRVEEGAPRDLSKSVAVALQRSGLPALGAAVVTSNGLESIGAAGVRSWGSFVPVTADDQWHIGSCTKAMTATLVARLIDRGVLRWDTTIGSVLGASVDPAWKDVSVLWLLCHRSGAPLNFSEDLWEEMVARGGTPREQRRFFVQTSLASPPPTTPNTQTRYSNSGYLVAGVLLETLTDVAWEDLMRREVFEPLGMRHTGFGSPGTPGQLDQPLGHVRGSAGWEPVPFGPGSDNPAASGPAGTIHTTLSDWARFVAAHLRGERGEASYLTAATWHRLHTADADDWGFAPGWELEKQEGTERPVLHHLGSNGFWLVEATLDLDRDVAVLLVTNVSDDAVEAPFRELRDALVGERAAK